MVRAKIVWEGVDRVPVLAANQFLLQSVSEGEDPLAGVVLTVGYLAPPVLLGTPEEQREAASALDHVNVNPVARFSLSATKAAELAKVIQDFLQRMEAGRQS